MNVFVLDRNPVLAAQMQCDRHVVKMSLESAQILCTVAHDLGISGVPYRRTHARHPCVLWAARSAGNRAWLLDHAMALCDEYEFRYGRVHACKRVVAWAADVLPSRTEPMTPFALAMPEQYRGPDAVAAYRAYYIGDKSGFAKWTRRAVPQWFAQGAQ